MNELVLSCDPDKMLIGAIEVGVDDPAIPGNAQTPVPPASLTSKSPVEVKRPHCGLEGPREVYWKTACELGDTTVASNRAMETPVSLQTYKKLSGPKTIPILFGELAKIPATGGVELDGVAE